MSRIQTQINELKTKLKKVEFLTHILSSAKEYNHDDFRDVKDDIVLLLEKFVEGAITEIEGGQPAAPSKRETPPPAFTPENTEAAKTSIERADINAIASFAMDNRHLSNKDVSVINDRNLSIKGKVVGLEYPNVLVKTTTGPTIKVPLAQINVEN